LAGIVEAYEYLRWTRRYSRCGSFELKAIATDTNLALLKIGNILWKNDDEEAGLIEFVELTGSDREFIQISGRFATSFLARRIVWGTERLVGDLGAAIDILIRKNLVNPSNASRKIGGIAYTPVVLGVSINTQTSYRNLMDAATSFCDAADVGIKTVFDPNTGLFNIVPYLGNESQAVFSREYENIIEQVFTQSVIDYASFALVAGEGEGSDRAVVSVGGGAGEARYELYVDARDLREEDFPSNYLDALAFRGQSKLAEAAMVQAFDATVNQYGNLTYKVDFDIGSRIQAVSKRWGVNLNARITEVEESYDREGMSLNVTVQPGTAWINGYHYSNTAPLDLPITTANGVNPRIDRVILRWDNVARFISLAIKTGVPAPTPVPPDLTRNDDVWELALANLFINKGTLSVSADAISDLRLSQDVCGLVKSLVLAVYE
jgi:hypothetical protein